MGSQVMLCNNHGIKPHANYRPDKDQFARECVCFWGACGEREWKICDEACKGNTAVVNLLATRATLEFIDGGFPCNFKIQHQIEITYVKQIHINALDGEVAVCCWPPKSVALC